jgi:hypothetical protein
VCKRLENYLWGAGLVVLFGKGRMEDGYARYQVVYGFGEVWVCGQRGEGKMEDWRLGYLIEWVGGVDVWIGVWRER